MTRGQLLLATAAECLLLVFVARHWWRVFAEQRALAARARPPQALSPSRRLRRQLDVSLRRTWAGRKVGDRLDRAALRLTVLEAALIGLASALACGWLVSVLLNDIFGWVALVVAPVAANAVLTMFIRRRAAAMVNQLPELASALAGAAAAGLSLPAALRIAAEDLSEPVAGELRHILDSLGVGYPMEDALREAARRLPSRELDLVVTTLVVQARGGGNLVQALRRLGDALERRRDSRREVSSLTAGSASTAYLMVVFGFGITAFLQRAYPGSLDRTMGSPVGLTVVGISCALYVVGIVLVRRTLRTQGG
jgi:tight adherence protein B